MLESIPKRRRRELLLDKLQRSFVNVCIGVTVLSTMFVGYKAYEYFVYIKPLNKAQAIRAEEELLSEGKYTEKPSTTFQ